MATTPIFSTAIRAGLALATLFFVACGDDDVRSGECLPGQVQCGEVCTSIQTSFQNCGACGNSCLMGQTCSAGACMGVGTGCENPSETQCGDSCVDTMSNSTNCGGCGVACLAGTACIGGVCGGSDAGTPDTGSGGFDSGTITGDCSPACDATRSSSCGQMGGMGPMQCLCGAFSQCPVGQACVSSGASFICANLMFDPMNCGAVGNACQEGESCNSGVCGCGGGVACAAGQACCGGACADATSDAMNCGGCGVTCGDGESCNGGVCGCGAGGACRAPMAGGILPGMGGDPGQSCCAGTCVENTDASCGCMMCTGEDTCQVGGGGIIPGMGGEVSVCCGGAEVAILGCGGGLPFP